VWFLSSHSRASAARDRNIYLYPGSFRQIAECPHLAGLRELDLSAQSIPA